MANIGARAEYRRRMVEHARETGNARILSPEWVIRANNEFTGLLEAGAGGRGADYDAVLRDWQDWFSRSVRYA